MKKFFVLAALLICGCGEKNALVPEMLPTKYAVVEDLGNGWKVIEIPVQGHRKRFLYRCWKSGADGATEVMAEIQVREGE